MQLWLSSNLGLTFQGLGFGFGVEGFRDLGFEGFGVWG